MQIVKRDGRIVDFQEEFIVIAIEKAMAETELGIDKVLSEKIAKSIQSKIKNMANIEVVQDLIEEKLMASNRKDVAKRYILYREEHSKKRQEPKWEMTEMQQAIWDNKYKYKDESFNQWLIRVSGGNEEIIKMILHKKFLYAGRILAGRGTNKFGKKVTMSNCFVLPPPQDNIESIFDTAKQMARTYSWGGGVGIDISNLRPNNAKVNNASETTSGSISFMTLFSTTTELIGQRGRRGALMITINDTHPDLVDFINCKTDLNAVTKANISIKISDAFMKAVDENKEWELFFDVVDTGERITKMVNAKDVYHLFCKNDWNYAEPSAVFWDRIISWNLMSEDEFFEYVGLNPCFTGDMKLLTKDGYKTFEELNEKQFEVVNINGEITESKVWCSGEKETIKLVLSNKKEITCTPNHVFMTIDEMELEANNLKGKKIMPYTSYHKIYNDEYIKYGFMQGDGGLGRLDSDTHKGIEVNIGEKDNDIRFLFRNDEYTTPKEGRTIYLQSNFKNKLSSLKFDSNPLPTRLFPKTYEEWNIIDKASFLQGCYSANGSIIKTHRVSYKVVSLGFAEQLMKTLKDDFNINSYMTTNKPKDVTFNNGTYTCKQSYDVNISKYEDIQRFHNEIGFYHLYKKIALRELLIHKCPYVMNIKPNGINKVYDFTEPKTHWGIVEGYIVHNCAEEPLPEFGSCNLGSVNLSELIDFPFTNKAVFNYVKFDETVRKAVIAMNEILDESILNHMYPLEEQRQIVIDYRQIGIGIMGLADMLIKMGIRYGNTDSIKLCDEIGFAMINSALQESALYAKEHGTFAKYNKEAILKSPFLKYNATQKTIAMIEMYGLANSQILTIAPTGSLSSLLGVSGGIEPVFANYYERKTESLHDEETIYKVYTPIVKEYMDKFNIKDDKDLPDFFVTSQELNFFDRVDMQSVWQMHIDASISSTVNLPYTTSVRNVEDLYMYAWSKGLKGITIFRDGCKRTGILTVDGNNQEYEKANEICPECKCNNMIKANGCSLCLECGYSPCL